MADNQGDDGIGGVPGHFIWTVCFPPRCQVANISMEQGFQLCHLLCVVGGGLAMR